LETKCIDFAEKHGDVWRTYIVRPGGVASESMLSGMLASTFGKLLIRNVELGAVMASLAVAGDEDGVVIHNARLVERGRNILLERGST
jgi:hypothetical protein